MVWEVGHEVNYMDLQRGLVSAFLGALLKIFHQAKESVPHIESDNIFQRNI